MNLEDMAAVSTADGHSTTDISRPAGYAANQQDSQNNELENLHSNPCTGFGVSQCMMMISKIISAG